MSKPGPSRLRLNVKQKADIVEFILKNPKRSLREPEIVLNRIESVAVVEPIIIRPPITKYFQLQITKLWQAKLVITFIYDIYSRKLGCRVGNSDAFCTNISLCWELYPGVWYDNCYSYEEIQYQIFPKNKTLKTEKMKNKRKNGQKWIKKWPKIRIKFQNGQRKYQNVTKKWAEK